MVWLSGCQFLVFREPQHGVNLNFIAMRRQNRLLILIFAVIVALMSSCEKNESINPAAGGYSIEKMRTLLSSPEYLPNTDSTLKIWVEENSGGFKSDPIVSVRFNYPENFFKQLPNGNYEQFVIYSIIVSSPNISDSLFDMGRIKTEYDGQAQVVGKPKLLPGWKDDEDCVKVYFDCTNQNTENIILTFTYSSYSGEISFTKKYQEVIYLPQNIFKLFAQMDGSILAETQEFHPANTDHVVINLIPDQQNVNYIIDYDVPQNVNGGDQIVFYVFGKTDTIYKQRLPINIQQQLPITIQFWLNFMPDQVDILIRHVNNETQVVIEEPLVSKRAEKLGPDNSNIYKIVDLINIDYYHYYTGLKAKEIDSIRTVLIQFSYSPPEDINSRVVELYWNYYQAIDVIDDVVGSLVFSNPGALTYRQKQNHILSLQYFVTKAIFCKMKFESVVSYYQIPMPLNWTNNVQTLITSLYNTINELKE